MLGGGGVVCEKPKIPIDNCSHLSSNIAFYFALPVAFCFVFIGLCYNRLHCILGWNYTGEQDEVHPEF